MLDGVLASYIHVMNNIGDGLFRIVTSILGGLVMWCLVVLTRWIVRKSSPRSKWRR